MIVFKLDSYIRSIYIELLIKGVLHDNTHKLVQLDRVWHNSRRDDRILQRESATRRGAANRRSQLVLHGLHARLHPTGLPGHVSARAQGTAALVHSRRSAHIRRRLYQVRRCSA